MIITNIIKTFKYIVLYTRLKIFNKSFRGDKAQKMNAKMIVEIVMGIIGMSGLVALGVVLLLLFGIFI